MKINREELLNQLESVLPGLSQREIIEQSSCFVFLDGQVITYNDEISCSHESCLDIKGAIVAMPLINILRKLPDEILEVSTTKKELLIKGKSRRRISIRLEVEIELPIESIKKPKKWKDLPDDFADAISMVKSCAGKNETEFTMTCIHLTPEYIEACDNYQAARFMTEMDLKKDVLVRKESLKYIISLDMTEFGETKSWIHFRNSTGLVLSCRRFVEDYQSLSKILKVKGEPTILPKGLKEAAERAMVFSAENSEDSRVTINLQKGRLTIKGEGASGWFKEDKKVKYNGSDLSFTIDPTLLIDLVQRHNKCQISKKQLIVRVGKFKYTTVLGASD